MIWGIRLFKKGKKLVENDSDKGFMREVAKITDKDNPLIDNHLCKLAKVPFIYYVNTCNFAYFQYKKSAYVAGKEGGSKKPKNVLT